MTTKRKTSWNFFDKFLSKWRSRFIKPYLTRDSLVLDVGCGQEGKTLVYISSLIKEGYGYDFNLKSLQKPKPNIYLSNKDFSLDEKEFDVISLLAVLEHLVFPLETNKILKNIFNKLKDDGVFILTTPDKRSKKILEFLAFRVGLINKEEILDHKHYFDKNELINILKEAGFNNIKHKYFQFGLNNLITCRKN